MKNPIFTLFSLAIMSGIMLINCQTSSKEEDMEKDKAQDTESYLAIEQGDMVKVIKDTATAYQNSLQNLK